MKRMIESVMQRATIILVCVVLILAWGAVSAVQMQRDYLPGINKHHFNGVAASVVLPSEPD